MKCGAVAKNIAACAISSPVPFLRMGVCVAMRRMNGLAAFSPEINHSRCNRVHCNLGSERFRHHFSEHVHRRL